MTQQEHDELPVLLTVRESRYRGRQRGFRVQEVLLVTTLLDAQLYPLKELAQLYWQRWQVETEIGQLKTTLGMDILKMKTPLGVRKELTAFAIVYYLVRAVLAEAGHRQNLSPSRISFIDALRWLASASKEALPRLLAVPWRPHRFEPRSQKRRAKKYPYMKRARAVLKQELLRQRLRP